MKKFQLVNIFAVVAALALLLPGCSNVGNEDSPIVQAGEKVALQVSVAEGYRTALPGITLSSYSYVLTAEGKSAALFSGTYGDLTKAGAVQLEAGSYDFTLKAYSGEAVVLVGTASKTISATDAAISFAMYAPTESADGSLAIMISNAGEFADYGVTTVTATAYSDAAYTTALDSTKYALTASADLTSVSGAIPAGKSYVRITLSDGTNELGSLDESAYGVAGAASGDTVAVPVEKYVATVTLTLAEATTTAPAVTLTNKKNASLTQTLTAAPVSEATKQFTFTGLVPKAIYTIKVGSTDISGKTVAGKAAVSVDMTKTLQSITAVYDGVTRYAGIATEADVLKAITITGVYKDSFGTPTTEVLGTADSLHATVTGYTATDGKMVAGTYTVTVTNGSFTASTISITIAEDAIVKISAVLTSGVQYSEEDVASVNDVVVTPTWASGKTAEVLAGTEYTVSPDTALTTSVTALTVTLKSNTAISATVAIQVSPLTVFTLKGETAKINLGKKNIEAKAYLKPSEKLSYNSSASVIDGVEDNYPNLNGSERTLDVVVKNVAAFTLYVKSSAGRTFLVKIGSNAAVTVTHPGNQTIDGANTDVIPFTFNTGTTEELTIQLIGGNASAYPGYVVLHNTAKSIPATKVTVSGKPTEALLLTNYPTGTTYNDLSATVEPSWHTDGNAVWTSSDTTVATIDSASGKIQPVAAGKTTITATVGSVHDEFELTVAVANVPVTGVTLDKTSLEISRWGTVTLTATVVPADATNKTVKWESSNAKVATVQDGVVTALIAGSVTITATSDADPEIKATATITVNPVYVSAGAYNLSTTALDGFVGGDGKNNTKWESSSVLVGTSVTHNNINTTSKIDSNGPSLYPDAGKGAVSFSLNRDMKVTFATTKNSFNKVGKITSSAASITQVSTAANDNATVAQDGKSATIGDTATTKKAVLYLSAGDYTVLGNDTSSAFQFQTITFEEAKLTPDPNTGVSVEIGWLAGGISLKKDAEKANTVSLVLPDGLTVADNNIEWLVFGKTTKAGGKSFTLSDTVKLHEVNEKGEVVSETPLNPTKGTAYTISAGVLVDGVVYDSGSITIIYE